MLDKLHETEANLIKDHRKVRRPPGMTSKNQIVSQSFIDDQFKMLYSSNDGPHKKKPVYENYVSPRRELSPDEQKEIVKSGFCKVSNKSLIRLVGVRPKSRQRTTQSSKQQIFNKGRESH